MSLAKIIWARKDGRADMGMSGHEIREVLKKAAAIVRVGWCRGALARNAKGQTTGPRSPGAVAWCALGAIQKICGGPNDGVEACRSIREVIGYHRDIGQWNDGLAQSAEAVAKTLEEAASITT